MSRMHRVTYFNNGHLFRAYSYGRSLKVEINRSSNHIVL